MKKFRPKFFIIPDLIMYLPPADRFVFGAIWYFEKMKEGFCKASNKEIARIAMVEIKTVQNSLDRLEKEGFIVRIYKDNNRRVRERISTKVSLQKDTGIPTKGYEVSLQKGQISNNMISNIDNTSNAKSVAGVSLNLMKHSHERLGQELDTSNVAEEIRQVGVSNKTRQYYKTIQPSNSNELPVKDDSKPIQELIDSFKELSPITYKSFFGNTTERKAAGKLLNDVPPETLKFIIEKALPKLNVMPYVPKECKAFKPTELLRNIDRIKAKIHEVVESSEEKKQKVHIIS